MKIEEVMKKIYLLVFLFAVSSSVFSQTKYLIYLKDKGVPPTTSLQKSSSIFKLAEKELSPRSIERRKQVMGEDHYITYEDIPLNENYIHQIENLGIKIKNKLKWFNAVSAYLNNDQVDRIKIFPFVDKVEEVHVVKSITDENKFKITPADKNFQSFNKTNKTNLLDYGNSITQNALSDIPEVHDLGITGTGVYVGILDDGFSPSTYNSLKTLVVVRDSDYVHNLPHVSNQSGHGSAVFCLMAGFDPGHAIGPAYGAEFFLAETENDVGEKNIEEDNYAAALQDMEEAGVDITTSSLGYSIFDTGQHSYTYPDVNGNTAICTQALNIAFNFGISTFNCAGNSGNNAWHYVELPADAFNVIAVGAVDSFKQVTGFSSRGPTYDGRIKPEVVAMGSNNYIAMSNGVSYGYGSGTSYSTPIAAGIAALLKSAWPHLTNVQIRKIFLESGDNSANPNNDRGWGLISAKKAITYPNLEKIGDQYKIHKIFIDNNGVVPSSVSMMIDIPSYWAWIPNIVQFSYDGSSKFSYTLPSLPSGYQIEIQFFYTNNNGAEVFEPATGWYKFYWGNLNIDSPTSIEEKNEIPSQFSLSQNYPNPFNPSTVINYKLSVTSKVSLKVYDLLGREVATLVDKEQMPGSYNSQFSIQSSPLPSGVYFYRLQAGDFSETKKMLLLK